jgi:hypothetical protein
MSVVYPSLPSSTGESINMISIFNNNSMRQTEFLGPSIDQTTTHMLNQAFPRDLKTNSVLPVWRETDGLESSVYMNISRMYEDYKTNIVCGT